jgi:fatty acid desaturase
VLLVLSPVRALVFVAVNQALFGVYLGCAFAPNHKGMPNLGEKEAADFLRRQVLTSRNVRGGPVTDWVLGGLNYQIEHHLFPSMPRVNLKRAQPLVRAFCAERGVAYRECGAFASYRQALGHLNAVGAAAGASAQSATGQAA